MRRCLGIALAALLAWAHHAAAADGRPAAAPDPARAAGAPDPAALRAMALNIYHEAKGEGRHGMLAVGWVVLNRMADAAFPDRVEEVVGQGCQFGWLCDARPDEPADPRAWRQAVGVAGELLAGAPPPADPTRGAMWFHHAGREDPAWGDRIAPSARVGNHLFYAKTARLPRPRPKPQGAAAALALAARR